MHTVTHPYSLDWLSVALHEYDRGEADHVVLRASHETEELPDRMTTLLTPHVSLERCAGVDVSRVADRKGYLIRFFWK